MSTHRADKALRVLTGITVAGLAIVAGAVSFDHMQHLALAHDQHGWRSFMFPISVDAVEIIASLYILSQRRAGRPTGWLPWAALFVGAAARLTANILVGGSDIIGKAIAGWPALSMLVAVKLFFSMFDHHDARTGRDDQRPSADRPSVPGTTLGTDPDGKGSSGTVPADRPNRHPSGPGTPAQTDRPARHGERARPVDLRDVAHLIPAARAARTRLAEAGRRTLSRDALADAMRETGTGVRASPPTGAATPHRAGRDAPGQPDNEPRCHAATRGPLIRRCCTSPA